MADTDFHVDDDVCDMEMAAKPSKASSCRLAGQASSPEDELIFTTETLEAIEEAERIARDPNVKGYTDIDELMKDLLADA